MGHSFGDRLDPILHYGGDPLPVLDRVPSLAHPVLGRPPEDAVDRGWSGSLLRSCWASNRSAWSRRSEIVAAGSVAGSHSETIPSSSGPRTHALRIPSDRVARSLEVMPPFATIQRGVTRSTTPRTIPKSASDTRAWVASCDRAPSSPRTN